jgi:hypothetical protein
MVAKIEEFATSVLDGAYDEDLAGRATKSTAKAFLDASLMLETLQQVRARNHSHWRSPHILHRK